MKRRATTVVLIVVIAYLGYCSVKFTLLANAASGLSQTISSAGSLTQTPNIQKILGLQRQASTQLGDAQAVVNDPLLAPMSWLPVFGEDFSAAKTLVASLSGIVEKSEPVLAALQEFATRAETNDSNAKPLTDNNLAKKVTEIINVVDQSRKSLEEINTKKLHFGLGSKIELAHTKLNELSLGLAHLKPLVAVLEPILTNREKQTWFVATQNLAEARGTGGLLGSFALLEIMNGHPSLAGAGSDQDLDRLGRVDPSALPRSLQILWGGTPDDWRDINVSSHVPYFAAQISETLSSKKINIDGVIVLGQGTVAQLVSATGGMNIDGVQVNGENISDFLAKGIYAKYEDVGAKNAWVKNFMHTLFARLAKRNFDYSGIWSAATRTTSGDRISAWAKSEQLQARFRRDGVDGAVSNKSGSVAQISLNNAGGNKLDAYLELEAKYSLGRCGVATDLGLPGRRAKLDMLISNKAPKSGLPKYVTPRADLLPGQKLILGSNRTLVSVYAPVNSTIDFFTLNGETVFASQGFDHDHPVWVFDLSTLPGRSYRLVANWVEPTVDSAGRNSQTAPSLIAPVALNPVKTSVSTSGVCAAKNK